MQLLEQGLNSIIKTRSVTFCCIGLLGQFGFLEGFLFFLGAVLLAVTGGEWVAVKYDGDIDQG